MKFKSFLTIALVSCGLNSAPAQTWVPSHAPAKEWLSIASSVDGTKLVASEMNDGGIYASTNSGLDWTETTAPKNQTWVVTSSADGTNLAAAENVGVIYTSTNAGSSWNPRTLGSPKAVELVSIASSADGTRLATVGSEDTGGYPVPVYFSNDSGKTWSTMGPSNNWSAICMSADGTKLAAAGVSGLIWVSTNSGVSWATNNSPNTSWRAIACSADGAKLVATSVGVFVYTSTNYGVAWQIHPNFFATTFYSVASSADGVQLAAAGGEYSSEIYLSTDSGNSWFQSTVGSPVGSFIVSSADGNSLVDAGFGGSIYLLRSTPSPQMNIVSTNANLMLSWTVPSTNFGLQQSSDLLSWINVTNVPVLNLTNLQDQVSLSASNTGAFYRLKTP